MSKRRLTQELARRGVDSKMANAAIADVLEEESVDERALLEAAARKKLAVLRGQEPDAVRKRLYGYLARRGYDSSDIAAVLRTIMADYKVVGAPLWGAQLRGTRPRSILGPDWRASRASIVPSSIRATEYPEAARVGGAPAGARLGYAGALRAAPTAARAPYAPARMVGGAARGIPPANTGGPNKGARSAPVRPEN